MIKTKDVFTMPKHYEYEYKQYICRLVVEEGQKIADLSRDLNINDGTIQRWVSTYRKPKEWEKVRRKKTNPDKKPSYLTPTDYDKKVKEHDEEMKKLKEANEKEIKKLKEENDILKKAMHVFTQNLD